MTGHVIAGLPIEAWAAISAAIGAVGTWLLGMRTTRASIERERIIASVATLAAEQRDREDFRATLMREIVGLRTMINECEADRRTMRTQINDLESEAATLKASAEITARWLDFLKTKLILHDQLIESPAT
jgi:chromosome segregation ATPase